jgi:hypothetical protein
MKWTGWPGDHHDLPDKQEHNPMTHNIDLIGNRKIRFVIPAACLAFLTLGSVSWWGSTEFSMLPVIFLFLSLTFSLIIIASNTIP